MEKQYADKEQDYLKQLKDEMRAKIKSKTTAIRNQYKTELNQEIEKLKVEWTQEHLKTNEQHNAQISLVLKEVEVLKEQSEGLFCQYAVTVTSIEKVLDTGVYGECLLT